MHLFYQQAFDALYQRHDSYKPGGYKREFRAKLSEDVFKAVVSYFCLLTYYQEKFSFSPGSGHSNQLPPCVLIEHLPMRVFAPCSLKNPLGQLALHRGRPFSRLFRQPMSRTPLTCARMGLK